MVAIPGRMVHRVAYTAVRTPPRRDDTGQSDTYKLSGEEALKNGPVSGK
jgi:hypothetical protein